jgi:hypothetical protein
MHTIELEMLNNARLELRSDEIIIWCKHNRDYTLGQYYRIDKNNNVYLCHEKETEFREYLLKTQEIKPCQTY